MQNNNYTREMFADYPDVVDVSGLQSMLGNIGKQKAYELVREGTIKAIKVGKLYRIPKINVNSIKILFKFKKGDFNV